MANPSWPRAASTASPWSPIGPDEDSVRFAALRHLGVAGDDLHPGLIGGATHRTRDPSNIGDRQALFQDEGGRQPQGSGAHDRQVIDRATHRQASDVTPRKEQRRNDVGIRRDDKPGFGGCRDDRPVIAPAQGRVVEGLEEHLAHQAVSQNASAAVPEYDRLLMGKGQRARQFGRIGRRFRLHRPPVSIGPAVISSRR
jgi:hypothetical protein